MTRKTTWHDTEAVVAALYHRASRLLLRKSASTASPTKKKALKDKTTQKGLLLSALEAEQIAAWMDQALHLLDREGRKNAQTTSASAPREKWRVRIVRQLFGGDLLTGRMIDQALGATE